MATDSPALVVIVPTRGRHQRLRKVARRFAETTPAHRLLFVCDPDDLRSQRNAAQVGEVLVTEERHGYPRKVNEGIRHSTEALILVGSDDLKPLPGWYEAATALLTNGIGYVCVNDMGTAWSLGYTISPLVTRAYAEQGTIDGQAGLYFEGYWHNPCDVEAAETAKHRGAFALAPNSVIEHLHPNYGKSYVDRTYLEGGFNQEANGRDQATFEERRALWA